MLSADSPHDPLPVSIFTYIKSLIIIYHPCYVWYMRSFRGWLLFRYEVNTVVNARTNAIGSRTSFVIEPVRSSTNGIFLSNGRYTDYLSFTCTTSKGKNIKSYTIYTTFKKRGNIKNINTLKPFKINTKILMIRSSHEVVTKRKVSIPSFLSWPPFLIH